MPMKMAASKTMAQKRERLVMIITGVIGITVLLFMGVFVMKFFVLDSMVHTIISNCRITSCEIWSCGQCNATKLLYSTIISSNPKQLLIGNTTQNNCDPGLNTTCTFNTTCNIDENFRTVICYYYDLYSNDTLSINKPQLPIYGIWTFVSICIIMAILIIVTGTLICNFGSNTQDTQKRMQMKPLLDISDDF
jgi:hypothetical protein